MNITGGSHKTSTLGNDVIVSITGGEKVTLSGAKGKTISVVSESDDTTPTTPTVTAQEVIKKFMKSLDDTYNSGVEALDEAVSVASGGYFTNIQSAITSMVNDCKSASSASAFLKNKCDINLDNSDTGAITGYDAGGSKTVKTAYSIVPEEGNLDTNFTDTSFSVNGVTFTLYDPKYSLTDPLKKYIWQGFKTWWAKSVIDLITESYGDNYSLGFHRNSYEFGFSNLGTKENILALAGGEGVDINMDYFKNIIVGDKYGKISNR